MTVFGQKIIDQVPDLIEVKFRRRVRIQHRCMVNPISVLLQNCFDRQGLDIDIRLHQGCEMGRNLPNLNWLNAAFIDDTRNFHAAIKGQIFDQIMIRNIAVDYTRNASLQTVNNE